MKVYKNYILKKLNKNQVDEINKQHIIALKYWHKSDVKIDQPIIPYENNSNYYWFKVDN